MKKKQIIVQQDRNTSSNSYVAIYPRVSTQEQAVNGYSIDEQIDRMTKYCEAKDWSIYNIYTDAGYSGATTDRPALKKLLRDIKKGKINKVLVYKLDRLSRSQKDTLMLIEDEFLANGVDFVSMSENFDTSTAFGRAMVGILAVFAQLEREQIRERMAMGREARAKKGKFHGSNMIPIGYDYVDGKLVVNEYEAMQVRKIFDMYIDGKSPLAISNALNEAGFKNKYGDWKIDTVRVTLSRQTSLGVVIHNGEVFEGEHDAIIDRATFDKAQTMMEIRSKEYYSNVRRGKVTSYLGGFLECGLCGKGIYKKSRKKLNGRVEKYVCITKQRKVNNTDCNNTQWEMKELDNLVFDEIRKLAFDPNYISELKETADEKNTEIIQSEIEKLDAQISRLMDLYSLGTLPMEMLNDKIADINENRSKLEEELHRQESIDAQKTSHDEAMRAIQSFDEVLNRADFDEVRSLLSLLIEKIVVTHENVDIYWRFI